MARAHKWMYLVNEEGQPLENANLFVYTGGGDTTSGDATDAAKIFDRESGGTYFQSYRGGSDILQTNANGYAEFWIADQDETDGYATSQKFKYVWNATGITEKSIDNVDVFPLLHEVDETDSGTAKNKAVSNYLAKYWSDKASVYSVTVSAADWSVSAGDYVIDLEHNLDNDYPLIQVYNATGTYTTSTPLTAASLDEDTTRIFMDSNNVVRVTIIG